MSSWEKAFDAFTWKNKSESTETPLDASHLNRINTALDTIDDRVITLQGDLDDKVDKVNGKGLSTNDYTDTDKNIVNGVTTALGAKADKVTGATADDLATLNASGNLTDSGVSVKKTVDTGLWLRQLSKII
jgi:hypothetical protein